MCKGLHTQQLKLNSITAQFHITLASQSQDSPMKPAGKVGSVRTFPSTLIRRCFTILFTSSPVSAYFRRFLSRTISGRHSLSLCGPGDGLGAYNGGPQSHRDMVTDTRDSHIYQTTCPTSNAWALPSASDASLDLCPRCPDNKQ